RPIQTYDVRPRILAGTASIPGAVEVRADTLRRGEFRQQILRGTNVRQTTNVIRASRDVPPPRALGPRDAGVLGYNPPHAALGRGPSGPGSTTGAAPYRRDQERRDLQQRGPTGAAPQQGQDQRGAPQRGPATTGVAPDRRDQERRQRDLQD